MMCCDLKSPKGIAGLALRLSFGLSILFLGISHYMTINAYTAMVGSDLGPLAPVGELWGYILPGLLIVGGVLMVAGMYCDIAAWAAGIGLGSIPAGLFLKTVVGGADTAVVMPMAQWALVFLLIYWFAVKSCCCGSCSGGSCGSCGTCK